jgi:hypothetical protein
MKCGASDHGVACPREATVFSYPMPRSLYRGPGLRGLEVPLCKTHQEIFKMERSAFRTDLCDRCLAAFPDGTEYD